MDLSGNDIVSNKDVLTLWCDEMKIKQRTNWIFYEKNIKRPSQSIANFFVLSELNTIY